MDEDDLKGLVATYLPGYADLPLIPLATGGTQNLVARLGDDFLLRLPLSPEAGAELATELTWLPRLAPHLPLAIPEIVAQLPDGATPHGGALMRWIEGRDGAAAPPADQITAARDLAATIRALHAIPLPADPPQGRRGGPLVRRDAEFRAALAASNGLFDTDAAAALWQAALALPAYAGPPVLLHADLIPANLIFAEGRLTALIDFAMISHGDPAWDLIPAWFLLDPPARAAFRDALAPDAASWARARAHVLAQSVIALPYYLATNPQMTALARRGIAETLAERAGRA